MEQKIFDLKLTTHATSLYLLLASLAGQDMRLDRSLALDFWNASEAEMDQAFAELLQHEVMREQDGSWVILPVNMWS
jgi:hypothetical protein